MSRPLPALAVAALAFASVALAADGTAPFAKDLWTQLGKEKGNVVYSPYSIGAALDLARQGAKGATRDEIEKLIHDTSATLAIDGVSVANHLWGQEGYHFEDGFKIDRIDFRADPEAARQKINGQISKETHDKIKELIARGLIDSNMRLVLTNALYMKAKWEDPFETQWTKTEDFTRLDGSTLPVHLMHHSMHGVKYGHTDALQVVELPYEKNQLVMDVILPKDAKTYAFDVDAAIALLTERGADVYLPRFEVTTKLRLGKQLQALGMKTAFDPSAADFSGFTGNKELYVSEAVTETYIKVDEAGTEAAAATAILMKAGAAFQQPPVFKADRTFFFAIRDTASGAVLFCGRIDEPTRAQSEK
jgi:serpin B